MDRSKGFKASIVSYKDRGPYGNSRYRGNTTGRIVRDFLMTYHGEKDGLFVDPMVGGGTSLDVGRELGIPTMGFDLRDGFDAATMDLRERLPADARSVFLHPPYAGMIPYSGAGGMWGERTNPADLSSGGRDIEAFVEMLQAVLQNVYRALAPGGHYALLLGLWRKNGVLHHLPARALQVAPGALVDEIVKVQHRCASNGNAYSGDFVRIAHETMLVFRRESDGTAISMFFNQLERLSSLHSMTWKNVVLGLVREGETVTSKRVGELFLVHPKASANRNLQAKARQTLAELRTSGQFEQIRDGVYRRVAPAAA